MTQATAQFQETAPRRALAAAHAEAAHKWLVAKLRHYVEEADHLSGAEAPSRPWGETSARQVTDAAAKLDQLIAENPDIPFEQLARAFPLTPFEHDTLLLCVAVERAPDEFHELLKAAQPSREAAHPTFALAFKLFGAADRGALLPHRPLRALRLVDVVDHPELGLASSALRADEHVVAYGDGEIWLNGAPRLDSMLALYVRPVPAAGLDSVEMLTGKHREVAESLSKAWMPTATRYPVESTVYLSGADAIGKLEVAAAAAGAAGRWLFVLAIDQLPSHRGDLDTWVALWKRDSLLYKLALYIDHGAGAPSQGEGASAHRAALARLLGALREFGPVVVSTRDPWPTAEPAISHEIDKPTRAEQRKLWAADLPESLDDKAADAIAGVLAWQFNLDARTIAAIARRADDKQLEPDGSPDRVRRHLWDVCRSVSQPALEGLARRVEAKATWDDIVLPTAQFQLLKQLARQVDARGRVYQDWGFAERSSRGLGIAALFAGESGTGKTMAAEVLATDLNLDLYRIDLSAVVSKYIGETEKNLRRLFDGAEDGGAILLFDEADALFGKRSEVKDSHDRYSNIEINYLLQRMEAYRGLAILATNMKSALDTAFMRRLRFTVNFPFPSLEDRERIWSKAFPPKMLADLGHPKPDYARLARLQLAGGSIYSVALNTAFLAADRKKPLTTQLVLDAARDEYSKIGREIKETDFTLKPPGLVIATAMRAAGGAA